MEYSELLKDERWKRKRDEVLRRDNYECQIKGCYSKKNLEAHHLFYLGNLNPWEYSNECLVTLCGYHHQEYHDLIAATEQRLCLTLKTKGFMLGDLLSLSTLLDTDFEFTQSLLKTLRDMQHG